jgi:hypothetical protein
MLGAALVVNFDSMAMIVGKPLGSFALKIHGIQDDYQSGTELPHSKGSADLLPFPFLPISLSLAG